MPQYVNHEYKGKIMKISRNRPFPMQQQGAALFVALMMLIGLTIIGLSGANRSTQQEAMAANAHLKNMSFNAAESALNAFMLEANTSGEILTVVRFNGRIENQCYDYEGKRITCGATPTYLDVDKAGVTSAGLEVVELNPCDRRGLCGSYSLGGNSSVGCRLFGATGSGKAATVTDVHELTAFEVTSCID